MSLMEQKKRINDCKVNLEKKLSKSYEQMKVKEKLCFRKADGVIFSLSIFPGEDAFVIEYAENYEAAQLFRFEDGDRFYLDDLDEESMFEKMVQEIES